MANDIQARLERARAEFALQDNEFATKKPDKEISDLSPEEIEALKREADLKDAKPKSIQTPEEEKSDDLRLSPRARGRYTAKTQPRDASGRFRQVLARLKSDLGVAGLERVMRKVEAAENLDNAGDYEGAVNASQQLLETIDRLDSGALNSKAIDNVRTSARQLGEVIANLPFDFGNQAEKIRFSDVPPTLRDLMESMLKKVEAKIGPKDAAPVTAIVKDFMSGNITFSQADISREMSTMLRLLT